jgi:hypothetical protein
MIRTSALAAVVIGGFMIVHTIAQEAWAQQTLTERRITLLGTAPSSEPRTERRIALVVGNSNYETSGISLRNPTNDATDVAEALQRLGFEVLTAIDANKREFERNVADFARMGKNADVALFFYAGHAMQLEGQNYLMPIDTELKDGDSILTMVRLDDVRRALDRVSGLKVMILDACRNNPLSDGLYRSAGGGDNHRGLRRIDKTEGMIVVYATAADEVAEDGKGRNSPFTSALLTRIDEAGLEFTQMLKLVGADVSTQTGGHQRPEITVQSYNDYFLNRSDRTAWEKIKDSGDPSALQNFIQRFRSSPYYPIALDRLARLAPPVQSIPSKPAPPNPMADDQSPATAESLMTLPPAQQPVQPAGPLPGDHLAIPKLDVMADTTPSDQPAKPSAGPRIDPAGDEPNKPSAAAAGTGTRKGGRIPPDAARTSKHSGEKGRSSIRRPTIHDADSGKASPQSRQQNAEKPSHPAASPTIMGQAF